MPDASTAWTGRLFLGAGRLLYAGPVLPTEPHAHHAFQVMVCGPGAPVRLADAEGREADAPAAVIPPDTSHAFVTGSLAVLLLYVDPESLEGRRLRRAMGTATGGTTAWTAAAAPLTATWNGERPATWEAAVAATHRLLTSLVEPAVRPQVLHPGILRALRVLGEMEAAGRVRTAALAPHAGVSAGRLSHLWAEQLGIPLRPFVLWRRMQRAASVLQRGGSLSEAAAEAGFADGAHLTRVFRRMFGIRPSDVAGYAEWVLPPAPGPGE